MRKKAIIVFVMVLFVAIPLALAIPPTVAPIVANGQTQRSTIKTISAQFSEDVSVSLDKYDLTLVGSTLGLIDLTGATLSYDGATDTATWSFSESLPDDLYSATLSAAAISNSGAEPLDGNGDGVGGDDATFEFHRLFGDTTGDAVVDYNDLELLALRWLNTPFDTGLDADDDNFINMVDFAFFADNWGWEQ